MDTPKLSYVLDFSAAVRKHLVAYQDTGGPPPRIVSMAERTDRRVTEARNVLAGLIAPLDPERDSWHLKPIAESGSGSIAVPHGALEEAIYRLVVADLWRYCDLAVDADGDAVRYAAKQASQES
ncbi:MAG TPA: hypothetical protein VGE07_00525 [Herpetosiphonaceae bacterium]